MIISTFRHLPWCMSAATLPYLASTSVDDAKTTAMKAFQACHAQATAVSHNPRGHVLGFIGFGNIGQQIAAKMGHSAFGMKIAYYDVVRKSPATESELNATFHDDLASLLAISDCAVLCTPAFPDGKPMITSDTLRALKPGARFVNIARGSLVDEDALADALESGAVSSAALDVHANEPKIHPRLVKLASLEGPRPGRVMLTCHNAGGTVETHVGFEELSMRNITAVLTGEGPITPVNMHFLKK